MVNSEWLDWSNIYFNFNVKVFLDVLPQICVICIISNKVKICLHMKVIAVRKLDFQIFLLLYTSVSFTLVLNSI